MAVIPPGTRKRCSLCQVEILGLDVTRHAISFYEPMFTELGVVRAKDLLRHRSQAQVMVAGIKVATQTPPSGAMATACRSQPGLSASSSC